MSCLKTERKGDKIAKREWAVCFFSSLTLALIPWSFAGAYLWALHILSFLCLFSFLLNFIPLPSFMGFDSFENNSVLNIKKLLSLRIFWVGVLFILYIYIQFMNPSVQLVRGEGEWWVESIDSFIPMPFLTSVISPYSEINALRVLVINLSALLLALSILVGLNKSATILTAIWSFLISGVIMGFVSILQKISSSAKVLWFFESSNPNFLGTFIYRNQGAAFLVLVMIISGLMYFFYLKKSLKGNQKGGPYFFLFLFLVISYASIWISLSRGGILMGGLVFLLFVSLSFLYSLKRVSRDGKKFSLVVLFILLIGSAAYLGQFTNWKQLNYRFFSQAHGLENQIRNQESPRYLTTKATFEMAKKRLIYGWGAGSFRYIFPIYQKQYDKIFYMKDNQNSKTSNRKLFHYAHNDWVQFLAEYGIVGSLLLATILLYLVLPFSKILAFDVGSFIYFYLGIFVIIFHNYFDFIFSAPSYWIAFFGCITLINKLFYLDNNIQEL